MINNRKYLFMSYALLFVLAVLLIVNFGNEQSLNLGDDYVVANAETIESKPPRTAEIIYSNLNGKYGTITYSLQIWINRDKLLGKAAPDMEEELSAKIEEAFNSLSNYFAEKGYEVSYQSNPDNLLEVTLASYSSSHERAVSDPTVDGYEPYDPFENLEKWGFFKNLYSTTSLTVYSNIKDTVIEKAINILMDFNLFEESDIVYIFNYGTSVSPKTIYSNSDALYYSTKQEMYIHEFAMTIDQVDSKYITLYQNAYNSLGWNITLIAITVVAIVVVLLVIRKKKDKANSV